MTSFVSENSIRVGVDLVRVTDIAKTVARFGERYITRVFTADEAAYCNTDAGLREQRLAARFAVKEATLKVLRPTCGDGVSWRSIEVLRTADGWCEIGLHGEAAALAHRAGLSEFVVSMSHENEYATATVVARRMTCRA